MKSAFATLVPALAVVLAMSVAPVGAADHPATDSERGLTQPLVDSRPYSVVPPSPFVPSDHDFDDVPTSSPFHPFVSWLAGRGISGGCAPNLFCPDQPVTRAQMAVFMNANSLVGSPLAFGFVEADGSLLSGSGNVTSSFDAGNIRYAVTVANHSYVFTLYTTLVTLVGCPGSTVSTDSNGGTLLVIIRNPGSTANMPCRFQFATYFNGI